jgi:hypothetical protein
MVDTRITQLSEICQAVADALSPPESYYEKNLGAGMFLSPDIEHGFMGYTEPLRRFIQPE